MAGRMTRTCGHALNWASFADKKAQMITCPTDLQFIATLLLLMS